MNALIKSLSSHLTISDLENLIEEKKALDKPKKASEDDLMKDYLKKHYLKYKNPLIAKK